MKNVNDNIVTIAFMIFVFCSVVVVKVSNYQTAKVQSHEYCTELLKNDQ